MRTLARAHKPGDAKKRKMIDKALEDLDPSTRDTTRKLIEGYRGADWERKLTERARPDFYLPDFDVYVEYWGLVDVPDEDMREDYIRKMKWKMAQYHNQGIKFVSVYPSNMNNFDYVFPKKFEEVTGINFPVYPRSSTTPFGDGSLISCRYCNAVVRKGERFCGFCGKENP
jgi:hypothetical protein